MLKQIIALGSQVEKAWIKSGKTKQEFSQICLSHLQGFDCEIELESLESQVSKWLLDQEKLPEQLNVYDGFGQPPLTVFNNGQFVVDLYFWTTYNTSIHSHSFAGAFKILHGQSLHEKFQLTKKQSFTHDIELNEVELKDSQILHVGDSHSIISGESFCHRVIHLDQPTLTLCIRTLNDSNTAQWHYFENGLSIRKRDMDQNFYKKLFYFQYLFYKDDTQAMSFINHFLNNLEDSQVMNMFEQILTDQMGLNEDSADFIHNLILDKYKNQTWFSFYEKYYQELELNIAPKQDTPLDRFYAHAANSQYSQELSTKLASQIRTSLF